MSYEVYIKRTKFTDLIDGTTTFGIRIYDDCTQTYNNMLDVEDLPSDPIELIEFIMKGNIDDETIDNFFYYIREFCSDIFVDNVYIAWERIEHLFNK